MPLVGPVSFRAGRQVPSAGTVDLCNGAAGEGARADQLQIDRPGQGREKAQPAAERDRMNQQPVLVDETEPHKAPGKSSASVRHPLLAGLLLPPAALPSPSSPA